MGAAAALNAPGVYRVVQWATGSMGRTALRRVIDHPDLELVGVYVYDERKVGIDAGDIARRPATGVRATNRIEDVLALEPDVVLHMSRITEPYDRQNGDIAALLGAGVDVISTAGFHHPACHGVAYAGPLLAACRRGGSTLTGVGLNPGFIAERLATMLTGMCARLDSVACFEVADASNMPSPDFVFGLMGFGANPAERDVASEPIATMYSELFMEVLHTVADALGARLASLVPEHSTTLAPRDLSIRAGEIRRGTVAATNWRWRGLLESGVELVHSVTWTADPALQGASGRDAASWRIEIRGRPNVRATIVIDDPDPDAPHTRAAVDATVAIALRAIPDVLASPPGFFAFPALAPYRARLR
ncbi:MAG: NAD(P)H-dependent amine dehydrogenase family protein [Gammaproteobacteria bacterium]